MAWIACQADDLALGDAVMLTRHLIVKEGDRRRRFAYRHTGRVIYTYNRLYSHVEVSSLVIERVSDVTVVEPGYPRARGVDNITFADLNQGSTDLHRHSNHGPSPRRRDADGKDYLLALLRDAAGGDHENLGAVMRVASCVPIYELDRAQRDGDLPRGVGPTEAAKMLQDGSRFSEAVLRQLTGQMPRVRCEIGD